MSRYVDENGFPYDDCENEPTMTDNEIIKALECCGAGWDSCKPCPLYEYEGDCLESIVGDILDLINRQKAKIECLEKKVNARNEIILGQKAEIKELKIECGNAQFAKYKAEFEEFRTEIRADAIKEFAYKLKNIPSVVVHKWEIDELVKEMVRGELTMPTGISGLYQNTKGAKIARGEKVTQTNYERIKAMSIEELADMLMCPAEYGEFNRAEDCNADMSKNCNECIKRWLEKECEE